MLKLVVDTNLLVSGVFWGGVPGNLLERAFDRQLRIVSSPWLMSEWLTVISRPKFAPQLRYIGLTAKELTLRLSRFVQIVEAAELPAPICRDPKDDAVLACALAAHAELIVSGDKDLLVLQAFQGIPILSAAQALVRLDIAAT